MPTYTFPVIRYGNSKTGKCARCGKTTKRSVTFEQTMNPFNIDPATGEPKTSRVIYAELKRMFLDWGPDFRHEACKQ